MPSSTTPSKRRTRAMKTVRTAYVFRIIGRHRWGTVSCWRCARLPSHEAAVLGKDVLPLAVVEIRVLAVDRNRRQPQIRSDLQQRAKRVNVVGDPFTRALNVTPQLEQGGLTRTCGNAAGDEHGFSGPAKLIRQRRDAAASQRDGMHSKPIHLGQVGGRRERSARRTESPNLLDRRGRRYNLALHSPHK